MKLRTKLCAVLITLFLLGFSQNKPVPQLGKNSIKEIIAAMTIDEKINIIRGIGMPANMGSTTPVAGSIGGKVKGAAGSTYAIPRLGIPAIILADGPAGLRVDTLRTNDSKRYYSTAFPIGTSLASTWNTELVNKVGRAINYNKN